MQVPNSIKPILDAAHCYTAMPVVWGEMDALGHVNNVVYFRYLETARVEFCRRVGLILDGPEHRGPSRAESLSCILHSVKCRFRRALVAPDEIWVTCAVKQIESDRLTLTHKILSRAFADRSIDPLAAEAEGIVVCYDYAAQMKAPVPAEVRAKIAEL